MSTTSNPISPHRFALALTTLPLESLHAKAAELRNSMAHLRSSNEQMAPFASQGDEDCRSAMEENETVMGRMRERVALLRAEVEGRGMRWVDGDGDDEAVVNGFGEGDGKAEETLNGVAANGSGARRSGRLTDEQLAAALAERMGGDDDEDEGVHL